MILNKNLHIRFRQYIASIREYALCNTCFNIYLWIMMLVLINLTDVWAYAHPPEVWRLLTSPEVSRLEQEISNLTLVSESFCYKFQYDCQYNISYNIVQQFRYLLSYCILNIIVYISYTSKSLSSIRYNKREIV